MFSFKNRIAVVVLFFSLSNAHAGVGSDRLHHFFDHLQSLSADFEQTVINERAVRIQHSTGSVIIRRPNKFSWDYEVPYEQRIVADGKRIWIYDADLDQVTVNPLEQALGSTPALLLSSDAPLEHNFAIIELGQLEGMEWLELTPRQEDSTIVQMRLAFDAEGLKVMEVIDSFDQTSRLQFSNLQRNRDIAPERFIFRVPPGVDIVGNVE